MVPSVLVVNRQTLPYPSMILCPRPPLSTPTPICSISFPIFNKQDILASPRTFDHIFLILRQSWFKESCTGLVAWTTGGQSARNCNKQARRCRVLNRVGLIVAMLPASVGNPGLTWAGWPYSKNCPPAETMSRPGAQPAQRTILAAVET